VGISAAAAGAGVESQENKGYSGTHEANISAEEAQTIQDPRLFGAEHHEDGRRDVAPPPPERPQGPFRLMPKHQRLSRVDFSSINTARLRRIHGAYLTLSVSEHVKNPISKPKFACVVSKKIAARAVDRNRIRRRCREAFRTLCNGRTDPRSFICYAKKEAAAASYDDIRSDLRDLLSRAG
jgi:ribonuclease P protein component